MVAPLPSDGTQLRDITGSALRVSLSTPTDCVAPLDKGVTIVGEVRLAVNVGKLTELAIIMLKEHLKSLALFSHTIKSARIFLFIYRLFK